MNETMKNLLERRSVRGYKKDLVPEEVFLKLVSMRRVEWDSRELLW